MTATSETAGYHLFAASAGDHWKWHALATLQPGGYSEQAWIGEHCITGDGRFVVAVVAPWSANNSAAGIAAGGVAYAVDAHTGAVRPLASGLMLSYFNPGCGSGSSVALSRYTDAGQSATQVLTVDASTGKSTASPMIANQVTSAVPVAGTVYAAEGRRLVKIGANGAVTTLSTQGGPVFDLTPNAAGGVDYLAQDATVGPDPVTGVYRLAGGKVSHAATGTLKSLRLLPGLGGRDTILGAEVKPSIAIEARGTPRGVGMDAFADVSSEGTMLVKAGAPNDTVELVAVNGAGTGGGKLPAPAAAVKTLPSASTTGAVKPDAVVPPGSGGDSGATCAVPRNDPSYQVPQPSDAQIEWALNLAGQYALPTRPSGYANLDTGAYTPGIDFPLPAPFEASTGIPRQIMEGIFAQESNWNQASTHAPAGLSGNPLISDYYGIRSQGSSPTYIDFTSADCGYGLGQITDMMRLAAVGDAPSALQKRVALDYAENAAATAQTLADKWNQLAAAGITVGADDPMQIEDWYFAIWAYNSGINPQAATGNTTGCTPGPSCADSAGNWGLGWTNNPANPTYNPLRHPFLHDDLGNLTYDDAATPQNWPYQEKVFGWIESGQYDSNGATLKYTPTHDYTTGAGYFLDLPGVYAFCDSSDNCSTLTAQPCGYNASTDPLQWHCWWHKAAGFCPGACHTGDWDYTATQAEPAVANPFPSICSPPADFADTYLVDDSPTEANLAGCGVMAAPNATMVWTPNTDADGQPFGNIDLHQLGTGYGGRSLFTHLEDPSNALWGGTMTWTPGNLQYDVYDIEVFVPTLGAAGTLDYTIHSGTVAADTPDGQTPVTIVPIDQNNYGNQWVSLGTYYLAPGANVTTTNVVNGGDGSTDVAFDAIAFRPVSSYVSLGDSYSSGVGTGSYDTDTNTSANKCMRSPDAYSRRWSGQYANGLPLVHLACSGASIPNLTTTGQWGEPAQIAATPKHAVQVSLTIGGNDVGFSSVLKRCIVAAVSRTACEDYYSQNDSNNLSDLIDSIKPSLVGTYQAILAAAPGANVVAVSYPNIFMPGTSKTSCANIGFISDSDVAWLIGVTQHLDNVIAAAASQAGVSVLDERYAFVGHELCTSSSPWVNGLADGLQNLDLSSSFHPNTAGYGQIAADLTGFLGASTAVQPQWSWRHPTLGVPSVDAAKNMLIVPWDQASLINNRIPRTDHGYTTYGAETLFNIWGQDHGCNIADIVRARDGDNVARGGPNNCWVVSGTWQSPYDLPANQNVVANNRDQVTGNSAAVPRVAQVIQIDHVVNLHDAWDMGASAWTAEERSDFGNDMVGPELVTSSSTINSVKLDQTIDTWTPPNPDFVCTFARMYTADIYDFNLMVTPVEYNAIYTILFSIC